MTQDLFVGVDGGATKCLVRVEDAEGHLIGQTATGAANIRISVEESWRAIAAALTRILSSQNFSHLTLHAGMGLAGSEVTEAYQAFIRYPHTFKTLLVTSDAHVACLGAHGGKDGAVIIAGTGVVGYQVENNQTKKIAGWGFPHDDAGGGAWLGLEALKLTMQTLDGRLPASSLSKAVLAHFDNDQDRLIAWANRANSTAFAELAPIVIQQSQEGDHSAIAIMQQAGRAIDQVGNGLSAPLPCAIVGGVSTFIQPYLGAALTARLRPCIATPDVGATLMIRKHIADKRCA